MKKSKITIGIGLLMLVVASCTTDPNSPGLEYMPDMYRSPAVEAYVDYGQDPYNFSEEIALEQRTTPSARKPVAGTIVYSGTDSVMMAVNMPYAYANTVEDYERAGVEVTSPIALSKTHFTKGEELYTRMCTHCHGASGKGDGAISTNEKILGIPSFSEKLVDLPEGKMFHTMTYGKGLMGSHASQLSKLERWQIIQYVQSLQTETTPKFDDMGNPVEGADEPAADDAAADGAPADDAAAAPADTDGADETVTE